MVYYNILGIFILRGVGGFIIRGRGLNRGKDLIEESFANALHGRPHDDLGVQGLGFRIWCPGFGV